jgi:hypothetical protein
MAVVVAVIAVACGLLFRPLASMFMMFPAINGAILAVLAVGIGLNLWQVRALAPGAEWIDQVRRGFSVANPPRLVAPIARVIAGREREGVTLSVLAMRSFLDTARDRMNQGRIVPRALIALVVVLGLLGSLWALTENAAMPAVMSTALFALGGAVVLSVVYLLARYAESRFFADLEDFLAARAQLPSSLLGGEGTLPAFLEALLKQTAESLSEIQRMMLKGEEERRITDGALNALHARLGDLADQLREEQKMFHTLAKNYSDLQPAIGDLSVNVSGALAGTEEMRGHLRSVDLQLGRVVEELRATREQVPQAIRQEIRLLAQTLGAVGGGPRARPEPRVEPRAEPKYPPHPQDPAAPPIPPSGAGRRGDGRPAR